MDTKRLMLPWVRWILRAYVAHVAVETKQLMLPRMLLVFNGHTYVAQGAVGNYEG